MMRQSIQQGRSQLRISEHATPFREGQIGGDDDAGSLIQFCEQVEQQCAPCLENGGSQSLLDHGEQESGGDMHLVVDRADGTIRRFGFYQMSTQPFGRCHLRSRALVFQLHIVLCHAV